MKISSVLASVISTCAVAALTCCSSFAQSPPPIQVNFHVPETVDPNKKIYFGNLTDQQTATGADLVNGGYPGLLGVEIHSIIAGANKGNIMDVTSFKFCFNYSGGVTVSSISPTTGYQPWSFSGGLVSATQYCYIFSKPTGSGAPINDNFIPGLGNPMLQSFASLTVSADAFSLTQSFVNQNPGQSITFQALTLGVDRAASVPEPGGIEMLFGTGVAGVIYMVRRRRK